MKNAQFQQKRSTTDKNETTFTSSKTSIAQAICRLLHRSVDAFYVALIKHQLNISTEAEMAGHWNVDNQDFLNHLISKYYNV